MPLSWEAESQSQTLSPRPPPGSRPQSAGSARRPRPSSARSVGESARHFGVSGVEAPLCRPGPAGGSRPQSASSGGRRILPAELGLAGRRVLTLPSHVDTCDQGEQCCWRWLAHSVLKEASWLKEDLDSARQEGERVLGERLKVEHDVEAFAELRGAHTQTLRELTEVRSEAGELRRELVALRSAHAHKAAREQELERELARAEVERKSALEREQAEQQRALTAERELAAALSKEEEQRKKLLLMEDQKARNGAEMQKLRVENESLSKAVEDYASKKKKKPRKKNGRSPSGQRK